MEQQTSHWITLTTALTVGSDDSVIGSSTEKIRRLFGQWVILTFYKVNPFLLGDSSGGRCWLPEYRPPLQETPLEIENERSLGRIVKAAAEDEAGVPAMHWDPAAN